MPLLDSFRVDHTIMPAPAVRIAKKMKTPKGDDITVFDLRFCVPNEKMLSEKGIHTLEHLFAGFIRNHLNSDTVEIIDVSPMGCRTGFYMSLIGTPDEATVATAWEKAMKDVLEVKEQSDIDSLFCGGPTTALNNEIAGLDQFELINFIVVQATDTANDGRTA